MLHRCSLKSYIRIYWLNRPFQNVNPLLKLIISRDKRLSSALPAWLRLFSQLTLTLGLDMITWF